MSTLLRSLPSTLAHSLRASALATCASPPDASGISRNAGAVWQLLQQRSYSSNQLQVVVEPLGEQCEGISVLSLNRPEAKNAIGRQLLRELGECVNLLRQERSTRCVVVRSLNPDGIFCAGADLKERLTMTQQETAEFVSLIRRTLSELEALPMPTIAVLEGPAFGGGAELALACDIRLADDRAVLALPETRLGIIPGAGGTQRLPRLVGPAKAKELIFTGKRLTAPEALALGLVNHLFPSGQAYARALDMACEVARGGPVALRMAKAAINMGLDVDMGSGMKIEEACYAQVIPTRDRLEGLKAFTEKRAPQFTGHRRQYSTSAGSSSSSNSRQHWLEDLAEATGGGAAAVEQQQQQDTIFALSSGSPPAGVAVVRISGPLADPLLRLLCPRLRQLPAPRVMQLVDLCSPAEGAAGRDGDGDGAGASRSEEYQQPGQQQQQQQQQQAVEGCLIDRAMVARFPGPASFTGEDVVELHMHGSTAAVSALFEALRRLRADLGLPLRQAKPGEFARRAFLHGKLELTQVEGLADLLAAETEAQRLQALAQSGGAAGRLNEGWRAVLVQQLARLEAVIDFGEDEGLAQEVVEAVVAPVQQLQCEVEAQLQQAWRGEATRQGLRVLLLGPPNSGKSSLLNALAGQDVALVSPVAGTTRDVVEVALQLGGYKVHLADTAGIRRSEDEIEAQGVARAVARLQGADLVLLVLAHPSAAALDVLDALEVLGPGRGQGGADSEEEEEMRQLALGAVELGEGTAPLLLRVLEHGPAAASAAGDGGADDGGDVVAAEGGVLSALSAKPCLLVMNKNDLWPRGPGGQQEGRGTGAAGRLLPGGRALSLYLPGESSPAARLLLHGIAFTSCVTQEGIPDLLQLLQQSVQALMQPAAAQGQGHGGARAVGGVSLVTRARHRQLLQECVAALQRYQAVCGEVDLAAEELRAAAVALGKLTGTVQVEEVLGAVFSEFCIGK